MGLLQRIFGKERRVFSTRASSREQAKALRTKDETTAELRRIVAEQRAHSRQAGTLIRQVRP